jgi:hypothetical protein
MSIHSSIEQQRCKEYLGRAMGESEFNASLINKPGLIVTQGFEQRSLGIIEEYADANIEISNTVINRYTGLEKDINVKYEKRFEAAANTISPNRWHSIENDIGGQWVSKAIQLVNADEIIFDITGISNKGMFSALDAAAYSGKKIWIAYSEPREYWPKESDWKQLSCELSGYETLADIVNAKPWLSGYEHRVELVPKHEGYDSAGSGRALIGFLPFKCARLAAVLGEEDYEEFLFIAGRPRLPENYWRLEALMKINEDIIKEWPVENLETFGYLKTLEQLSSLLFKEDSLLTRYNVHLAITGSKLQTLGCWALSHFIPSITMVTSAPSRYYSEAFSDGIGAKWMFQLSPPVN